MSLKSLAGKVKDKAGAMLKKNNNSENAVEQSAEENLSRSVNSENTPEQSSEKNLSRRVKKVATKVTNISKKVTTVASEIQSTAEIASFQKDIQNLRKEGKITQDILDAILCENPNKLSLAYSEAMRAEAMGQPLPYLSEEQVKAALSVKRTVAKAVLRKCLQ